LFLSIQTKLRLTAASLLVVPFAAQAQVDFNREIRPILSENCFQCHGPDEHSRKGKLRLDHFENATAKEAIFPGDPARSEVVARIRSTDPDEIMPPPESHHVLSDDQKALLEKWITEGARYADHWAFISPKNPEMPTASIPDWPRNPIDQFILARIAKSGLSPSPEATKEQLIRRVTQDLTGLPPTPQEVAYFIADTSEQAYEKVVERLLASPHYGERMTLAWMDAARYGDSSVMHADGNREMWPWRDWVINAYNTNKPFDEFTIEQLAGDLLPNATVEQKVATGFNRNHATSDEGGAFAEELRVDYVVDRVKTTASVWMGLSMECAQCHDHKYDPIPQTDYYGFFAYFNNTKDPGMQSRNGNQAPVVTLTNPARAKGQQEFADKKKTFEEKIAARAVELQPVIANWAVEKSQSLPEDTQAIAGLVHHFPLDSEAPAGASVNGSVKADERGLKLSNNGTLDFPDVGGFEQHTQAFSLSAWVKSGKGSNGAIVSRMKTSQAYRGYDLWLQGGNVGTHIVSAWPDNAIKLVSTKKLEVDKWQHVAITYDGSGTAAGTFVFIDGEKVETTVEQDGLSGEIKAGVPFRIGGRDANAYVSASVSDVRIYDRALASDEIPAVKEGKDPLMELLATPAAERSEEQNKAITGIYLNREDKTYKNLTAERDKLAAGETEFLKKNPEFTSMIMEDNEKMRMTYVLDRGAYDSPKKDTEIRPIPPSAIFPPLEGAEESRLGLARWLTHPQHPLTSRVTVNRYWAMLFGKGLVKTVTDFGNQGAPPTHPELLDWLAVDFVENGWDIKRTLRQIVTSATYRQSARRTGQLKAADPENLLLAHSPRFRLQGEFIRDHALAVSGLLERQLGGPSVKPYQPENIWNEVSLNGGLRYPQDKGEKLYRRSIYTYWKRSSPMPSMIIFDAPSREKCVVERPRTNTPLQALVTLNGPQFVEASRVFAERILREGGDNDASRITRAFQLALSRDATDRETEILTKTLSAKRASFSADPESAKSYLTVGEKPRDESIPVAEHAAWTILCQMILNLDETLTRG
jgi:mono/diheme cytochrome c family protein